MKLKTRIHQDNIRAEASWRGKPPAYVDGMDNMNWYDVTLKMGRRQYTIPFGMGYAHTSEPTAYDVLACLLSDASSAENARSFEEWAGDYGYDTDSRSAERTYNAVVKQTEKLRRFLGDKFDAYVWDTEE